MQDQPPDQENIGRLAEPPIHASPAEHQAQADEFVTVSEGQMWDGGRDHWTHPDQHRNFVGFRQHRAMLPNETL